MFDSVNPFHYSSTISLQVSKYLAQHKFSEVQVLDTGCKHIKKKKRKDLEKKLKFLMLPIRKIFETIILWLSPLFYNGEVSHYETPFKKNDIWVPEHPWLISPDADLGQVVEKNHQHISNPEIKQLKGNAGFILFMFLGSGPCKATAGKEQADSFRWNCIKSLLKWGIHSGWDFKYIDGLF